MIRSTLLYSNPRVFDDEPIANLNKISGKQKAFKSSDLKASILFVIPLGLELR